ncbi:MAG: metalloregulator ArsR/SmtB family transcription factor [Fimbriimonas sp.]|nr:metalloregulator ArsR/SmtB family transcription factor [Fimbriimonas sp.]
MHNVVLFGQCLGDPLTIRVLALLRQGELCICEVQHVLGEDRSVVDLRLRKLRDSGIVRTRRRGQWLAYRIHTHYVDLVETVFEAFDETISWDQDVTRDTKLLGIELKKRVNQWCASPRGRAVLAESEREGTELVVEDGGCCDESTGPTARWLGLRPCARRRLRRSKSLRHLAV